MELNDILQKGLALHEADGRIKGFELLTLRTALKAYFSTYKAMKDRISYLEQEESEGSDKYYFYSSDYYEAYGETIIHFQHFFELVIKNVLRQENPLLVLKGLTNPVILHKLLNKETVDDTLIDNKQTIEFSQTLDYTYKLLNENRINHDGWLGFLLDDMNRRSLKMLNDLRNRLIHRGSFILGYRALDEFIGRFILPMVQEIVKQVEFQNATSLWKFKTPSSSLDPIDEIVNHFKKNEEYNYKKVAYLKEIGRAAYVNPLYNSLPGDSVSKGFFKWLDEKRINLSEQVAQIEERLDSIDDIYNCPVCGVKSLIAYLDNESECEEIDGEQICSASWDYVYEVSCKCCSFEVRSELGNPKDYGLPLEYYWKVTSFK